jgi:hypothetical protein
VAGRRHVHHSHLALRRLRRSRHSDHAESLLPGDYLFTNICNLYNLCM